MTVLEEIFEWSQDRPSWQRDALRRLMNGDLTEDDLADLTKICKGDYGLCEQPDMLPLERSHLPATDTATAKVSLESIVHCHGVNALEENQTLLFSSNLTVVYGDNAAGKTGYIRILKSACRARGKESILGNVTSGSAPLVPSVLIEYRIGDEEELRKWSGEEETNDFISRASVFDARSAAVYLTEKTDVAYRPFGLHLFDKLVKACKTIRSTLKDEQREINVDELTVLRSQVPEGTRVGRFLAAISSLTKLEDLKGLARFSPEEEERLSLLERSLLDSQANDPKKLIRQVRSQLGRTRDLANQLRHVEKVLSAEEVIGLFGMRDEGRKKVREAEKLKERTFPEGLLEGTGSETWAELWRSAQKFSEDIAYKGQGFPFVDNDARCVLCQQDMSSDAADRLKQFQEFASSSIQDEIRELRKEYTRKKKLIVDHKVKNIEGEEAVEEMSIEYEAAANSVLDALNNNERRREKIAGALSERQGFPADCPELVLVSDKVNRVIRQLEARIKALNNSNEQENRTRMEAEVMELRSRKLLATHKQLVLNEIERKKKVAAYELCLHETRTHAITQKNTAITKKVVTDRLKKNFRDELRALSFRHVEVEMQEAGGEEGILYHKLVLTHAPGVELQRVASEGEQRCLSIAAFFAELSTADDPSAIVFDDPVSSFDYKWRESVAKRLVQEAKKRQVIVFTHDIVFLLLLKDISNKLHVEQTDQHVKQFGTRAGICEAELPWVALSTNKKIGFLRKEFQKIEEFYRKNEHTSYEKGAVRLYAHLREAWERALEEVLLNGIVERYRSGVQTQQVACLSDITPEDCDVLNAAMAKCSQWMHDQSPAARVAIPEPDDLDNDIAELKMWVSGIRGRRK